MAHCSSRTLAPQEYFTFLRKALPFAPLDELGPVPPSIAPRKACSFSPMERLCSPIRHCAGFSFSIRSDKPFAPFSLRRVRTDSVVGARLSTLVACTIRRSRKIRCSRAMWVFLDLTLQRENLIASRAFWKFNSSMCRCCRAMCSSGHSRTIARITNAPRPSPPHASRATPSPHTRAAPQTARPPAALPIHPAA